MLDTLGFISVFLALVLGALISMLIALGIRIIRPWEASISGSAGS